MPVYGPEYASAYKFLAWIIITGGIGTIAGIVWFLIDPDSFR